jgi:hypothetical protein
MHLVLIIYHWNISVSNPFLVLNNLRSRGIILPLNYEKKMWLVAFLNYMLKIPINNQINYILAIFILGLHSHCYGRGWEHANSGPECPLCEIYRLVPQKGNYGLMERSILPCRPKILMSYGIFLFFFKYRGYSFVQVSQSSN